MAGSANFNGVNSQGDYDGAALLSTPFTICAWCKTAIGPQAKDFFGFSNDGSTSNFALIRQHNGNAGANRNSSAIPLGGAFSTGVWHSVVGVFDANLTAIYLDGAFGASDAGAVGAGSYPDIVVGYNGASSPAFFAGQVAHCSIHTGIMSTTNIARHAAGVAAPQLGNIWGWWPLESNGNDLIGGRNFTLANVTFTSDGPSINYGADPWAVAFPASRPPGVRPYDSVRYRDWRRQ